MCNEVLACYHRSRGCTYKNDNEHVEAERSNSIVVLLLQKVNDTTDEEWYDQITQATTDKEDDTQDD